MLAWTMLVLAAVASASEIRVGAAARNSQSYSAAHREMKEKNRPLLVLIGADWCPGCQVMKQTMSRDGIRKSLAGKVAYAQVNKDQEARIAGRIMRGDRIPQLVMFRRTRDGWKATRMIGSQSESAIQSFVESGLKDALPANAETDAVTTAATSTATPVESQPQEAAEHTATDSEAKDAVADAKSEGVVKAVSTPQ